MNNDKVYCVYMHENKINGMKYIGATKNVKKRWCSNGVQYRGYGKFYDAIQKFGWNNFNHVILKSDLTKEEAAQYEDEFIQKYNTISDGYNAMKGGNLPEGMVGENNPFYKDHRFSGSRHPMFGRKHSPETRKKMSENHRDVSGSNNPFYGDHRFLGGNHPRSKPVRCIETGIVYETVTEAEQKTGVARQNIRKQINGKLRTAGGYHWEDVPKCTENA